MKRTVDVMVGPHLLLYLVMLKATMVILGVFGLNLLVLYQVLLGQVARVLGVFGLLLFLLFQERKEEEGGVQEMELLLPRSRLQKLRLLAKPLMKMGMVMNMLLTSSTQQA